MNHKINLSQCERWHKAYKNKVHKKCEDEKIEKLLTSKSQEDVTLGIMLLYNRPLKEFCNVLCNRPLYPIYRPPRYIVKNEILFVFAYTCRIEPLGRVIPHWIEI